MGHNRFIAIILIFAFTATSMPCTEPASKMTGVRPEAGSKASLAPGSRFAKPEEAEEDVFKAGWKKRGLKLDIKGFDNEIERLIREEAMEVSKHFKEESAGLRVLVRPFRCSIGVKDFKAITLRYFLMAFTPFFIVLILSSTAHLLLTDPALPLLTIPLLIITLALGVVIFPALIFGLLNYYNAKIKKDYDGGTIEDVGYGNWMILLGMEKRLKEIDREMHYNDFDRFVRYITAHEMCHVLMRETTERILSYILQKGTHPLITADAIKTIRGHERKYWRSFSYNDDIWDGANTVETLCKRGEINDLVKRLKAIAIAKAPTAPTAPSIIPIIEAEPAWTYRLGIMLGAASLKLISDRIGKKLEDFTFEDYQAAYDFVKFVARNEEAEEALEKVLGARRLKKADQIDQAPTGPLNSADTILNPAAGKETTTVQMQHSKVSLHIDAGQAYMIQREGKRYHAIIVGSSTVGTERHYALTLKDATTGDWGGYVEVNASDAAEAVKRGDWERVTITEFLVRNSGSTTKPPVLADQALRRSP